MNVLVIEDDRRLADAVHQGLAEDGHQVHISRQGDEGLSLIQSNHFDAVVLDLMLPVMDGFTVLHKARTSEHRVPILILTARDSMADIIRGLDLGADDYLTKPFQLEVFLARVRAVGRRGPIAQPSTLRVGGCLLDRSKRAVVRDGEDIPLTRKEFVLLELLMRRANSVVTRDQLIEAGWGYDKDVSENSIEFYIYSLRSKLRTRKGESMIRTVRGHGYYLSAVEAHD
jgi:two-component system copper resistance phosphate regulon response regulator CusR